MLGATKFARLVRAAGIELANCTILVVSNELMQDDLFWANVPVRNDPSSLNTVMLEPSHADVGNFAHVVDYREHGRQDPGENGIYSTR